MQRRFPSATLAELRTDPRTFPTIIFPSVEADILNALMAEFSSSDRAEDELILFFEEKLYDGHVSNFLPKILTT